MRGDRLARPLAAVFGGYLGNKNADPIFKEGSNYDNAFIRGAMDATLGSGYQRPFELATLRLTNMTAILNEWDALAPADDAMLVQRGGSFVFEDGVERFRHGDAGILGYCPVERLVEKALSADAGAPPDPVPTIRSAAKDRSAFVDDVYASIAALEKRKPAKTEAKVRRGFGGKWRLVYTSGTKNVKANLNKAGFAGVVLPRARDPVLRRSKRAHPQRDLPRPDRVLLRRAVFMAREPRHAGVHVHQGEPETGAARAMVRGHRRRQVGRREGRRAGGERGGRIARGRAATKPGANPFFKFVFADDRCIAATAAVASLALWAGEGDPETDASA